MALDTVTSEQKETYELRAEELRGTASYSRRMKRRELAKFLRSRAKVDDITFYSYEEGVPWLDDLTATAEKFTDKIDLGCQRFSGDNFKKLKKWALAKRE